MALLQLLLSLSLWSMKGNGGYGYDKISSNFSYVRYDKVEYLKYNDVHASFGYTKMKQLDVAVMDKVLNRSLRDPIGCRIYLAESSIPESGLGLFSAVNISKGDTIGYDDALVLFFDFTYNVVTHDENVLKPSQNINLKDYIREEYRFIDYFWLGVGLNLQLDIGINNEAYHVSASLPGLGAATNNAPGVKSSQPYLTQMIGYKVPNYSDLEAGASNEFGIIRWRANEAIPRGMEIFSPYGDAYFTERGMDTIPLSNDFVTADVMSSKFYSLITSPKYKNFSQEKKQIMWEKILNSSNKKVQAALPINVTYLEDVLNIGSALFSLMPDVVRSPEWLEENGFCMDNIIPRPSKLLYGGVGAFSPRFITTNSIITPVPLIIIDKSHLLMYEFLMKNYTAPKVTNKMTGFQLLLNYCFGHVDSSLLFLPYSSGIYFINHSSQKPNAKLRWSKHKFHKSSWFVLPPKDLLKKKTRLMLELIATQDIYPGDEIYIDYGKDWEQAWNTYLSNWKQSSQPQTYNDSLKLIDDVPVTKDYVALTKMEQKTTPYPHNVRTACVIGDKYEKAIQGKIKLNLYWDSSESFMIPCDILERDFTNTKYVALVHLKVSVVIHDIPHTSVKFISRLYTSNQAKNNGFRHSIGIPDEIFPSQWKGVL